MAFDGLYPDVPAFAGVGVRTPYGILHLPAGSRIAAYVRSTGVASGDDALIAANLVSTLSAGLNRCRSGYGDTVIVLAGHAENVADAAMLTNLVAGTRVIGLGRGSAQPTFTWTNTAGQWAVNKNDVSIQGLRLKISGANGIVKGILVTGSDVAIRGCDIEFAAGAALKATIGIEAGAGADRFEFLNNVCRGTATHNVTDGVKIVAALNDVRIADNEMLFSATAANGLVHFTAAALSLKVLRNMMYNTHTSSTACITVDNVAADGVIADNYMGTNSTGTATSGTEGIAIGGASVLVKCFQNFVSNDKATSGVLKPTVDT